MATGTVKWFNATKGFGFIQPDNGGKDVFLHISALERAGLREIADGAKVSFELESGRDGRTSASALTADPLSPPARPGRTGSPGTRPDAAGFFVSRTRGVRLARRLVKPTAGARYVEGTTGAATRTRKQP